MTPSQRPTTEASALALGTLANAIGAVSVLVFYLRSGSDTLMLDGFYIAVMAGASVIAERVSVAAQQPRSLAYPFGASVQEPLYMLFRTLVLLGILACAIVSAAGKLISCQQGSALLEEYAGSLGYAYELIALGHGDGHPCQAPLAGELGSAHGSESRRPAR